MAIYLDSITMSIFFVGVWLLLFLNFGFILQIIYSAMRMVLNFMCVIFVSESKDGI